MPSFRPSFRPSSRPSSRPNRSAQNLLTLACLAMALVYAIYPTLRCFAHAELSYNEGWNVYNAQIAAAGGQLYPAHPGVTIVNYPALSFFVMSALHALTGGWLLPARLVSLVSTVACALMAGLVLRALGIRKVASWLTAGFTLLVFCISATAYVGVDDPQMLSEAVFMAGFLLYVRKREDRPSSARLALVSLVFVLAGCIKHSPLEFPLAVTADLLLLSLVSTATFLAWSSLWVAAAIALNTHFGGPGFLHALFLQRSFSLLKSAHMFWNLFGPLLLPFCLAACIALHLRRDPQKRILALLLACGLAVGFYFEGGAGVSINVWFGAFLAMSMLIGRAIDGRLSWPSLRRETSAVAAVLFAWMFIPALTEQVWNPVARLRQTRQETLRFDQEVALLRLQPGPVLCESLLRCEEAGKPYVYDPFNATRQILSGTLSPRPLVDALNHHAFGAVQIHALPPGDDQARERFPAAVMDAIATNSTPVLGNEDGYILVPAK